MIYIIAIVTGLILGLILSPESESRRERTYDSATIISSVVGALLGVLFFMNFLGIRLTVGFVWLEAILWSLLGALILRLILGAFSYESTPNVGESSQPAAHEYRRKKVVKRKTKE